MRDFHGDGVLGGRASNLRNKKFGRKVYIIIFKISLRSPDNYQLINPVQAPRLKVKFLGRYIANQVQ